MQHMGISLGFNIGESLTDDCETRVTDTEGDGNEGMFIGGSTNSPDFINKFQAVALPDLTCFEKPIPFILKVVDLTNPDDVEWAKFYGSRENSTYSEVGSMQRPYDVDDPESKWKDFFFVTLKSDDVESDPHKIFTIDSYDGSYIHEINNDRPGPLSLPDSILPKKEHILVTRNELYGS